MGMYEQFVHNSIMESRTATTPKASSIQYGWYEIVNNTVHFFQTPCNIALIVEQLSNYNVILRKQIEIENDEFGNKNTMIDKRRHESTLFPTAPECTPNAQCDKRNGGHSKVENDWIKPNKCAHITCFLRSAKTKKKL